MRRAILVPESGRTTIVLLIAFFGLAKSFDLRAAGETRILAWGANWLGQTNVPSTLTNATWIAGSAETSLALKGDNTIIQWGQPVLVPANLTNVVALSCSGEHFLALSSGGTVTAWGSNNYGEANVPPGLSNVVAIAAGYVHSLALKSDGTVLSLRGATICGDRPTFLQD